MRRALADLVAGTVLLAGSVALIAMTAAADYKMGEGAAYDAGLMPRVWLTLAAACALVIAARGVASLRSAASDRLVAMSAPRLALAGGLVLAFVLGFVAVGYWIAVLLFVPAFATALGFRRPLTTLAVTVAFAAVTWVVFAELLGVRLMAWPGA